MAEDTDRPAQRHDGEATEDPAARVREDGKDLQRELEELIGRAIGLESRQGEPGSSPVVLDGIAGLDADLDYRNFYLEFIEKSNDAMYVVDLFGNFKFVNKTALSLAGYEKEELLGQNISRFLYPEGRRKAVAVMASLMRGKQVAPHEITIKTAFGDRVGELSVTLLRKGGFPIGVLGVARDITARKESERSLRRSEARLLAIVESLPFDVFALDREGRYSMQNSFCREKWGDIMGKTPAEVAPDESTLRDWKECNRRALAGETVVTELKRSVDGQVRDFYNVLAPVREGKEVTAVLGISMDITERRRGQELIRVQRDLALSLAEVETLEDGLEACLRAALAVSGLDVGGIYLLNPDGGGIELAVYSGLSRVYAERMKEFPPDSPQAGIVRGRVPSFLPLSDLPEAVRQALLEEGLKVLGVLPILVGKKTVGSLLVSSHARTEIPEAVRQALESIASQTGGALMNLRAKERLRENEKRYRELVGNIPVVSWTSDAVGKTLFVSPNVREVCGFSDAEILKGGHPLFLELIHREDRVATEAAYRRLFEDGVALDVEYRLRHRNGRWIWLREQAFLREEEDRRYAFGVFHDITERKRAEGALRESEERYRNLIEHSRELIFTMSRDGVFTFVNKAVTQISGWSEDDLLGRHYSEFVDPVDFPRMEKGLQLTLQGEDLPRGEARMKMRSGEARTLEYSTSRLVSGEKVVGLLGVARDITAQKNAENDRRSLMALKEREGISRWLHDNLGADLYNIILLADSIQKQIPDASVLKQQLDWITETSRKSLASIRNYLDFSSQTGFTFKGLVDHMETYGGSLLTPLGMRFSLKSSGNLSKCNLSGVQVFSVYLIFKESLTNIVKHARASKVKVKVSYEAGRLGLTIEDDGEGFTPDPGLSGRFGTANLRARADEMGADLHIEAVPSKGTRVDFSLPVDKHP